MDEAKILELARKAGVCGESWCVDNTDLEAELKAFARLVAEAERERHSSFDQRMAQIEQRQNEALRRIDAIEKAQADHYRNQQRMPGPFGR